MTEREQQEQLIKQGTWVEGFDVHRYTTADGMVFDSCAVGSTRVWVFFWAKHYMPKWSEEEVMWWRRRMNA